MYLDQVVLQYWFHGPLDTDAADGGSGSGNNTISGSASGSSGMDDVVARVSASQFRLTCSDATLSVGAFDADSGRGDTLFVAVQVSTLLLNPRPDTPAAAHPGCHTGCSGLAWNVTPGLPTVFGARYTLNIWFPLMFDVSDANRSTSSSNSSSASVVVGQARRFLLLPANANASSGAAAGSNSSSDAAAADLQLQNVVGPDGAITVVQPLQAFQAIVAIEPRRFFANISATNDYSFIETPEVAAQQQPPGSSSSSGSNSTGRLVRRKRQPNPRLPAHISDRLAWGSRPVGGKMVSALLHQAVCLSIPVLS